MLELLQDLNLLVVRKKHVNGNMIVICLLFLHRLLEVLGLDHHDRVPAAFLLAHCLHACCEQALAQLFRSIIMQVQALDERGMFLT